MAGVEDYDLLLRLAHDVPFKYVPGPVGVYRISRQGMFITTIATGEAKRLHRQVIEKALASAPHISGEAAQKIRNQVEITNFEHLCLLVPDRAVPSMLQHLQECPSIGQHPQVRDEFGRNVHLAAAASISPLRFVGAVCATLHSAAGNARQTRRLVAAVWTEVALGFLLAGRMLLAARAAHQAVRYDPVEVARKGRGFCRRVAKGLYRRVARGLSRPSMGKPSGQPT
jgi:hypothetical protein